MADSYVRAKKIIYTHNFLKRFASVRMLFERCYRLRDLWEHTLGRAQAEKLLYSLEDAEAIPAARRSFLRQLQTTYAKRLDRSRQAAARGAFVRNLRLLSRVLGLDATEQAVLECLLIVKNEDDLADCLDAFDYLPYSQFITVIAGLTDEHSGRVRQALAPGAILLTSGLVSIDLENNYTFTRKYTLVPNLLHAINGPAHSEATLLQRFCHQSPKPVITPSDFQTQSTDLEDLSHILCAALPQRRVGINILLYGPPGAGKTELARLAAREVGATLYEIPSTESDGSSSTPRSRVTALAVTYRMLQKQGQVLLFMDDADEILNHGNSLWTAMQNESLSKDWLNRILEENPVPTVWIVNDYEGIDEAYKRRFTTSIGFKPPGAETRKRLWKTVVRRYRAEGSLDDATLEALAGRYDVSVGLMDKALSTARLMQGRGRVDVSTLERLLQRAMQLRDGVAPPPAPTPAPAAADISYRLDLLNTTPGIEEVVRGVQTFAELGPNERPTPSLCLLFYGPPGTGKTAFADYLARALGYRLLQRRASDLLSMWVCGTEQNLAQTFDAAKEERAVLLIDECDSFLQQRSNARQGWEVTQVNELLTQIDAFRGGVLIMTTNMITLLDPASLRRFIKVGFSPLTLAQRIQAFEQYCGPYLSKGAKGSDERLDHALLTERLADLDALTLGDFRVLTQQRLFQSTDSTVDGLIQQLRAEHAHKQPRRHIGF